MLSCNPRQRKSRNLSYTNQFNPRRSLISAEKQKEKPAKVTHFPLEKTEKEIEERDSPISENKNKRGEKAECPRYQINSFENFKHNKNKSSTLMWTAKMHFLPVVGNAFLRKLDATPFLKHCSTLAGMFLKKGCSRACIIFNNDLTYCITINY